MSFGKRYPASGFPNADWQQIAIHNGTWPNGDMIFDVDNNDKLIDQSVIACPAPWSGPETCFTKLKNFESDHINHYHVEVN